MSGLAIGQQGKCSVCHHPMLVANGLGQKPNFWVHTFMEMGYDHDATVWMPLTLKRYTKFCKKGEYVRSDGRRFRVRLQMTTGKHWAVFVTAMGTDNVERRAGTVYVLGIGRWGIKSFGADSKPYEASSQPQGYEERGTLAWAAEKVANEFVNNFDYAAKKENA